MVMFSALQFGDAGIRHRPPTRPAAADAGLASYGEDRVADAQAARPGYTCPAAGHAGQAVWAGLPDYRAAVADALPTGFQPPHPLGEHYTAPGLRQAFPVVLTPQDMADQVGEAFGRLAQGEDRSVDESTDPAQDAPPRKILLLGEFHYTATAQRALREVLRQAPAGTGFFMETTPQKLEDARLDANFARRFSPDSPDWRARYWQEAFDGARYRPDTEDHHARRRALQGLAYRELGDRGFETLRPLDLRQTEAQERYGTFNHAGLLQLRERGMVEALLQSGPCTVAVMGMGHVGRVGAELRQAGFQVEQLSFVPLDTALDPQATQALRDAAAAGPDAGRVFVVPDADRFPAYDEAPARSPERPPA